MTARIRIAIAVAILFALAAHPAVHPLVKECPCVHEVATVAAPRADDVILALYAEELATTDDPLIEWDARNALPPRAPPAA
ncbi:MAG TPA: hypothetical protein VF057_05550 [Thermoanaerobaculia bacterium]